MMEEHTYNINTIGILEYSNSFDILVFLLEYKILVQRSPWYIVISTISVKVHTFAIGAQGDGRWKQKQWEKAQYVHRLSGYAQFNPRERLDFLVLKHGNKLTNPKAPSYYGCCQLIPVVKSTIEYGSLERDRDHLLFGWVHVACQQVCGSSIYSVLYSIQWILWFLQSYRKKEL